MKKLMLAMCVCAIACSAAMATQWFPMKGKSFIGEYVGTAGSYVLFLGKKGNYIARPLQSFSEKDRIFFVNRARGATDGQLAEWHRIVQQVQSDEISQKVDRLSW